MGCSMICVSLAEDSVASCMSALKRLDCAEIRIDVIRPTLDEVRSLFSQPKTLIATCRAGAHPDKDRKKLLIAAIEAGAAFVDVEIESERNYREEIIAKAKAYNCRVIVSFHDHAGTPGRHVLDRIVDSCFEAGADIAKIACTVRLPEESARLLGLLDDSRKIVVIGMGDEGRITRIATPFLGSPLTFASLAKGKETAEGQIDNETLATLVAQLRKVILSS